MDLFLSVLFIYGIINFKFQPEGYALELDNVGDQFIR